MSYEDLYTSSLSRFPHCDSRVLHAPGECTFCDEHKDWQELRLLWNVNFTGHYDAGKTVCPAEQARGLGLVGGDTGWHGNVPTNGRLPDKAEVDGAAQGALGLLKSLQSSPKAKQVACFNCEYVLMGPSGTRCALDGDPIFDEVAIAMDCPHFKAF